MNEWISVKDRLPQKEGKYLIFTKIHFTPDHVNQRNYRWGMEISSFYLDYGFISENGRYAKAWLPLPKPPKRSEL